jgi:hypothetical protein
MPPSQGASWEDWYRWILCEIYKKAGGDCKDLTGDDASRASFFVEFFDVHGIPVFTDPKEQAEFVALLKQLEAHLLLPGNDLPSGINQDLSDMLDKLLDALDK